MPNQPFSPLGYYNVLGGKRKKGPFVEKFEDGREWQDKSLFLSDDKDGGLGK
jgi:hypothetical protein